MFKDAKVGDKVWDFVHGWGEITSVEPDHTFYPIVVSYLTKVRESYTYEGKWHKNHHPTLFWDEIKFEIPPKPMPDLEVDTKILVWYGKDKPCPRYFHSFTKDGKIKAWSDGRSSFTARSKGDYATWSNWKLFEE